MWIDCSAAIFIPKCRLWQVEFPAISPFKTIHTRLGLVTPLTESFECLSMLCFSVSGYPMFRARELDP